MTDKSTYVFGKNAGTGNVLNMSNSSVNLNSFKQMQIMMDKSIESGKLFNTELVSTYSLVYIRISAYFGGVLAPNGDIHFVPCYATVGQKIDINGNVSTYSLMYTATGAYLGGVLSPNGDIHFAPFRATVGQKITTLCAKPFSLGMCLSSFFNKF